MVIRENEIKGILTELIVVMLYVGLIFTVALLIMR